MYAHLAPKGSLVRHASGGRMAEALAAWSREALAWMSTRLSAKAMARAVAATNDRRAPFVWLMFLAFAASVLFGAAAFADYPPQAGPAGSSFRCTSGLKVD